MRGLKRMLKNIILIWFGGLKSAASLEAYPT
jgi:hypothetical protein